MSINYWKFVVVVLLSTLAGGAAYADGSGDPAVASSDNGKYSDKDGNPTYKISADGTVDWYTYSGFRRYHSDCHVCHGPNGEGSSYAPALVDSPPVDSAPAGSAPIGSAPVELMVMGLAVVVMASSSGGLG